MLVTDFITGYGFHPYIVASYRCVQKKTKLSWTPGMPWPFPFPVVIVVMAGRCPGLFSLTTPLVLQLQGAARDTWGAVTCVAYCTVHGRHVSPRWLVSGDSSQGSLVVSRTSQRDRTGGC